MAEQIRYQHLVFGAGLIGGYVGCALAAQGEPVAMVARSRIAAKLSGGAKLTDYLGHEQQSPAPLFVTTDHKPSEFLWLTVKCTQVESTLRELDGFVDQNTTIFCCQNGLGSSELVKARYPENLVCRVMTQFNVAEPSPGHLHRGSEGEITLEEVQGHETTIRGLATGWRSDLLPMSSTNNMTALLWAKLQLNLTNAVNALADIPVKQMLEQRAFRKIMALLMRELLAVVDAVGIELPQVAALPGRNIPLFLSLPNFLFRLLGQKMLAVDPTVRTSMWWDLNQGKPTEIDYLNGMVVEFGAAMNVPCPANSKLVELIKQAEAGNFSRGITGESLLELLQ